MFLQSFLCICVGVYEHPENSFSRFTCTLHVCGFKFYTILSPVSWYIHHLSQDTEQFQPTPSCCPFIITNTIFSPALISATTNMPFIYKIYPFKDVIKIEFYSA